MFMRYRYNCLCYIHETFLLRRDDALDFDIGVLVDERDCPLGVTFDLSLDFILGVACVCSDIPERDVRSLLFDSRLVSLDLLLDFLLFADFLAVL